MEQATEKYKARLYSLALSTMTRKRIGLPAYAGALLREENRQRAANHARQGRIYIISTICIVAHAFFE